MSAAGTCPGVATVAQTYSQHIYPTAPGNIRLCDQSRPAKPAAYPNPADAVLNLATPETAEAAAAPRTAVLYNAQGREVRRSSSPAKVAQLPTADLPPASTTCWWSRAATSRAVRFGCSTRGRRVFAPPSAKSLFISGDGLHLAFT